MNCPEAQRHLFAEAERALDSTQRAALDGHVAQCAGCRRIRDDLSGAIAAWRHENAVAAVPNVEREWQAVRRKIRGGVEAGSTAAHPRRGLFTWIAIPIGAAAALALALYVGPRTARTPAASAPPPTVQVARADSIEVPGNASTMVYVDDKSGWLIVWASDAKQI